VLRTVKLALANIGNRAKALKHSEKQLISYQFRANGQMCSHQPRYTVDDNKAETDVCTQKWQAAAASVMREMRSSSESASYCHLQQSLDWKEQANGLASQVTRLTPMVFFLWGHINPYPANVEYRVSS
jgi:hypothetical protein